LTVLDGVWVLGLGMGYRLGLAGNLSRYYGVCEWAYWFWDVKMCFNRRYYAMMY